MVIVVVIVVIVVPIAVLIVIALVIPPFPEIVFVQFNLLNLICPSYFHYFQLLHNHLMLQGVSLITNPLGSHGANKEEEKLNCALHQLKEVCYLRDTQ